MAWSLDTDFIEVGPAWAETLMNAVAGIFWTSLFAIGPIYPSGRIETRLGRIALGGLVALALATSLATVTDDAPLPSGRQNPFGVSGIEWLDLLYSGALFLAFAVIGGIVVLDLAQRWRVADQVGRLQYRWFVTALGIVVSMVTLAGIFRAVAPNSPVFAVVEVLATLSLNLIPISVAIAVTRHGLFEINRIVSRTVAYATVTALTVAVYALVVTSTTWLAPQLPSVGVAVATLAAAAVFLPALRWVQRIIDRRFARERYDAERVVEAFGERLRTQVDPEATCDDLLKAVERTLQPSAAGLWRQQVNP